ncbi:MAG: DUF1343 domain-containing protein [Bacteroidales bacterium]
MVKTGLDIFTGKTPSKLAGKRVGIICHAPSVNGRIKHILDIFNDSKSCTIGAIFGPQHGLFGQTQDNMIEWEGSYSDDYNAPVYSLYGENRKPTSKMVEGIDAMVIDLQDVGARPYTYVWTMRLCMEAAAEKSIPVWVLDRPNPVAGMGYDGGLLDREFFTFVGMASIPLCHSMTIGEIALWLRDVENIKCDLNIIPMEGWRREMMFGDTGLPWVIPSPNMPTLSTAIVYPGMVLTEATNLSEARGTTIPFELFGAPWMKTSALLKYLERFSLPGCTFRQHNYIPTFHKYAGENCNGVQVHVTDPSVYRPVYTTLAIYEGLINTCNGNFLFLDPPYEYEKELMPFDILSGNSRARRSLSENGDLGLERERWKDETAAFDRIFNEIKLY